MSTLEYAARFLAIIGKRSPSADDIDEARAIQNAITDGNPEATTLAECRAAMAVLAFDLDPWIAQHGLTAAVRSAVSADIADWPEWKRRYDLRVSQENR